MFIVIVLNDSTFQFLAGQLVVAAFVIIEDKKLAGRIHSSK